MQTTLAWTRLKLNCSNLGPLIDHINNLTSTSAKSKYFRIFCTWHSCNAQLENPILYLYRTVIQPYAMVWFKFPLSTFPQKNISGSDSRNQFLPVLIECWSKLLSDSQLECLEKQSGVSCGLNVTVFCVGGTLSDASLDGRRRAIGGVREISSFSPPSLASICPFSSASMSPVCAARWRW